MRYKVGAEQLERVPAMAHRPGGSTGHRGLLRSAQPTPWMLARGGVACGMPASQLEVLDQDWEAAFVEKCPRCFLAILAGA
jgi:hypothetical protein